MVEISRKSKRIRAVGKKTARRGLKESSISRGIIARVNTADLLNQLIEGLVFNACFRLCQDLCYHCFDLRSLELFEYQWFYMWQTGYRFDRMNDFDCFLLFVYLQ